MAFKLLPSDASPRDKMVLHATRRLWQRRGIALSKSEYEAIASGIAAGLYRQVATGEDNHPVYEITYRNITVYAVWSPTFGCVKTFLPCQQWIGRDHRGRAREFAQAAFREARA